MFTAGGEGSTLLTWTVGGEPSSARSSLLRQHLDGEAEDGGEHEEEEETGGAWRKHNGGDEEEAEVLSESLWFWCRV